MSTNNNDHDGDSNSVLEVYDISATRLQVLNYVETLEAEQAGQRLYQDEDDDPSQQHQEDFSPRREESHPPNSFRESTPYSDFVEEILEDVSVISRRQHEKSKENNKPEENNRHSNRNNTKSRAVHKVQDDEDDDELVAMPAPPKLQINKSHALGSKTISGMITRAISGLTTVSTRSSADATSSVATLEAVLQPRLNRDLRMLPTPGAVSVVPGHVSNRPGRPEQQQDEEDVEGGTVNISSNYQPSEASVGGTVVARLVEEEEESAPPRNDASEQLTASVLPKRSQWKQNRLLMLLIGCLMVSMIVVLVVTTGSGDEPSLPNQTTDPPDFASSGANRTDTTVSPSSRAPVGESSTDSLPRGNLYCGTKALGQTDYRGNMSITEGGRECQPWDDLFPHNHAVNEASTPDRGLESNYCRNPDGHQLVVWCYTMDRNLRAEDCIVPDCNYCGVDFEDANANCRSTCLFDHECPAGQSCFEGTKCEEPAPAQGANHFYCGKDFEDAYSNCRKPCPSGFSNECDVRDQCFAATSCVERGEASYCGTTFDDANTSCLIPCDRGSTAQCPLGQFCFAGTKCASN